MKTSNTFSPSGPENDGIWSYLGRGRGRAVSWAIIGKRWCHGSKPRGAQSMASRQRGEPFGTWLEFTGVPESFHVQPCANGDSPQSVVGTVPRGHSVPCHIEGEPGEVGRSRTLRSSHAVCASRCPVPGHVASRPGRVQPSSCWRGARAWQA